jgi:7-cyano-7-deazaguanine synthase in queuosine biosynthesis
MCQVKRKKQTPIKFQTTWKNIFNKSIIQRQQLNPTYSTYGKIPKIICQIRNTNLMALASRYVTELRQFMYVYK